MTHDFSKAALLRYLETATRQGLLNTNTAAGLRAAASKLLEDLGEGDEVRGVDVHAAAIKYHNKHPGELRPESLDVYRKRLSRLLKQFESYVENPITFRPRARGAAKSTEEKTKGRKEPSRHGDKKEATPPVSPEAGSASGAPSATATTLAYPFPLRENVLAQIVVPRNLNTDEARRLCAFIMTLAGDYKPKETF